MPSQLTGISAQQDQLLRIFQRIAYSIDLGAAVCMFMVLFFPVDLYVEYKIPIITTLRINFWIIAVCCSVSLNCAGAARAFLCTRRSIIAYRSIRALVIPGAMYFTLILSLTAVVALFGQSISLRTSLILCTFLLIYVAILYRFIEYSRFAREQRILALRRWYSN